MKNLPRRDEALLSVPLTVHALIPGTPEIKRNEAVIQTIYMNIK